MRREKRKQRSIKHDLVLAIDRIESAANDGYNWAETYSVIYPLDVIQKLRDLGYQADIHDQNFRTLLVKW